MDVKYQRVKIIGKGSFGKAYLVKNTVDDCLCVVKQMETGMMDAQARNDAVQEALFLKKMEHPNIIKFHEVFMTKKGRLCIVMEYADGGDVHSEIKKQEGKLLPEARILSWFVQTCFALHHVHDRRVLHRDLKTQNIFLMGNGQIKLGDFGIARVLEATKDYAKTMVGTPYYLSPEIIEDLPYAYKTDVWSCGIVLFEMATLQHPFNADTLVVLAGNILQDEVPPIDKMYSPELYGLIKRMLRKEARERPSFREVLKCEFLQAGMGNANDSFKLGLDLSVFSPECKKADELNDEELSPVARGADDASNSGYDDDFDADSGDSEPEDIVAKSVFALKLTGDVPAASSASGTARGATAAFNTKAAALQQYLRDNTSEDEFTQIQALIRSSSDISGPDLQKAADGLRSKVSDLLGTKKAEPLLPMFQLLHFLEGVASSLQEVLSESPKAFKQKKMMMETFKRWDLNADGFITKDELERVLRLLGVSSADISFIFTAVDKNADGKVDYTEFVDWLYSGSALTVLGKDLPASK